MPRTPKTMCPCKCGQAPAQSVRSRKAACPICAYTIRLSREHIARGMPQCPTCALPFELDCLFDRECLPGDAGAEAAAQLRHMARGPDYTASAIARKGVQTRQARAAWRAVRDAAQPVADMPF